MKNSILFLISLTFCFSLSAKNIQLVFRYDDFMLKSDSLNEGVVRLFQKHHIPLVLGVIPCNSKETMIFERGYPFLPVLKQGAANQSIEIAQHGLNHINISNGEFGNVAKEEQSRRLRKGKVILDSIFNIKIITFIPPYNAYDCNTLDVIENRGVKVISSSLCINQPWTNSSISYFPETIENFGSLLSVLNHNKYRKGVVVVMFHHYTFDKKYTLNKLDSLLKKINELNYVKCVTFSQLYNNKQISDRKRMDANMEINLLSKYFHLNGMIQTTSFVYFIRILNLAIYLFMSELLYILSIYLLFKRKNNISVKLKFILGFLLMLLTVYGVWFHILGPLKLLIAVFLISISSVLILKLKFFINR
jgi:peptidoglycan/xylan/chitin deacetylase (PgdA/CDA1 family)